MGERVVIRDEPPLASEAPPVPPPPLNYGRGDRAGDAWRWVRPRFNAFRDALRELVLDMAVPALGGARQIIFALGLSFVTGGFGAAIDRSGDAAFAMWLGGLIIGLVIRVPLRGGKDAR